jgi:hypothetical protein
VRGDALNAVADLGVEADGDAWAGEIHGVGHGGFDASL